MLCIVVDVYGKSEKEVGRRWTWTLLISSIAKTMVAELLGGAHGQWMSSEYGCCMLAMLVLIFTEFVNPTEPIPEKNVARTLKATSI